MTQQTFEEKILALPHVSREAVLILAREADTQLLKAQKALETAELSAKTERDITAMLEPANHSLKAAWDAEIKRLEAAKSKINARRAEAHRRYYQETPANDYDKGLRWGTLSTLDQVTIVLASVTD
jgi:flagellar biosynthesis/type III secretory pathway protein FliH